MGIEAEVFATTPRSLVEALQTKRFYVAHGKPEISAVVVCFNEEENIGSCLESLKWCDEIVVVDSFSTDRTLEICRRYTDRIVQHPWAGYRDQMAFACSLATREWVFLVDADERVSPELREEIQESLVRYGTSIAAFSVPRLVYYLGRWWWRGGWYPGHKIKFFLRDQGVFCGLDPHPRITVGGPVRRLTNPLHHFSYRDITDHIDRINHLTTISAQEMRQSGRNWRRMDNLLCPVVRFLRFYLWKRGFLEGFPGFFIAVTAAYYVFLKYAKLKELELGEKNNDCATLHETAQKNKKISRRKRGVRLWLMSDTGNFFLRKWTKNIAYL